MNHPPGGGGGGGGSSGGTAQQQQPPIQPARGTANSNAVASAGGRFDFDDGGTYCGVSAQKVYIRHATYQPCTHVM